MAQNTDKTKLELLQAELAELRGQGVIDWDAEQRILWHYERSEAEEAVQPAAGTERENRPAAAPKARGAKRGILWYVFRAVTLLVVSSMVLMVISILALFAAAFTGSDALFSIFWDAGRACISIINGIFRSINAVDSAVNTLVEFFAESWIMFSTFLRVALSFVPVIAGVCCGIYTIVKDKGQGWREASALLTAAGFALLTWQISRIYDISGTSHGLLMLVMAVSLPLVYIFRGYSLAVLYCAYHLRFIDHVVFDRAGWVDGGFLHFLGIAPFIVYYLFFHKPADARTVWMRYICLMPLTYLIIYFGRGALVLNFFAAAGLLYIAGLYCDETDTENGITPQEDSVNSQFPWILIILAPWLWIVRQTRGRNPWTGCGCLSIAGLLNTVIIWPGLLRLGSMYPPDAASAGYSLYAMPIILFAAQVFITARRPAPLKVAISFVTLAMLICYMFRLKPENVVWAAGAALLLIGAVTLAEGLKGNNKIKANIGMVQMMAVFMAVDFTSPSGGAHLLNSAVLLVITVALIVMNLKMKRNSGGEDAGVPEEVGEYGDAGK